MPVKREIQNNNGHYFITFTCHKWLSLISITDSYDLLYSWFNYLTHEGHFITGYVIMPNHVHAIIAFRHTTKSLNKIIGDGKRFIGYEIINRLKKMERPDLLKILEQGVNKSDKARGKLHEIWEDSFDWKECIGDAFTWQKLHYMHNNPCSGVWNLAANPVAYEHSSALFYHTGQQGRFPVFNFQQLKNINLTVPN